MKFNNKTAGSRTRRIKIACTHVLMLTLFFGLNDSTQAQETKSNSAERILAVNTLSLKETTSFQLKRQFTGQIETRRRTQLGFERIGRISEVFVDRGDEVVAGQTVATLDCDSLLAQRRKLEAELRSAQALLREAQAGPRKETIAAAKASLTEQESQLQLASESLERRERMFAKNLISREEYQQAVASYNRWAAMVDGAQQRLDELLAGTRIERIETQAASVDAIAASLAQINVEIDKSRLTSPFDGKVVARELDEGSIVSPGRSFVTIVEHKMLEARIGVPQAFAREVKPGSVMDLDCNGSKLAGTVIGIVSEVDSNTRTQSVVLKLDDKAWQKVVAGETARATFIQEKKATGFWVPTECLTAGSRGLWNCFVIESINEEGIGKVVSKTVEVIHTAGENSMIQGPLQEGDVLISSAPHRIIAGQTVRGFPTTPAEQDAP